MVEKEIRIDEHVEKLFEGVPDAIFVLSGGIVKFELSDGSEYFRSPGFSQKDAYGLISGGRSRVIAAAEAYKYFPNTKIVTTSKLEEGFPSHASVMRDELVAYGVDPESIQLEEHSFDTETEVVEMIKMSDRENYIHVGVVTNEYHIDRVNSFLKNIESRVDNKDIEFFESNLNFKSRGGKIVIVSAENILELRSERYVDLINKVKALPEYNERISMEQRGVRQIEDGSYTRYYKKPLAKKVGYNKRLKY